MIKNVRIAFLLVWLGLPLLVFTQDINRKVIDEKLNKEILCGFCDQSGLKTGDFGVHYKQYYKIYKPDQKVISEMRNLHEGVDILIVLATWCHDSHEQVPRFLKILDQIKFKNKNLTMICVDGNKKGCDAIVENLDIMRVPTFIVYRKGAEIGRIIEKPYKTLEKDLLMLLSD